MKQNIFITGASGGIGSAITKKFNELILVNILSSKEKLLNLVKCMAIIMITTFLDLLTCKSYIFDE